MAELFTQTAKLVPYAKRPRGATGFVTAYAFEPAAGSREAAGGNFYAVLEVVSGGREAEEAVRLALQTAEAAYYGEEGPEDPLDRFELATRQVNQALTDYVNRGNAAWVGKMSGVLGMLVGKNLHLAYTGSAEAFLYRGSRATRITVQPHNRVQQPSKIFGSIASGSLKIGDRLLLATPALVHHLSLTNLKTIVSENSPAGAVAKITSQLQGYGTDRVAGLVLEVTTPQLAAGIIPVNDPLPEASAVTVPPALRDSPEPAVPYSGDHTRRTDRAAGVVAAALGLLAILVRKIRPAARSVVGLVPAPRRTLAGTAAAIVVVALIGWVVAGAGARHGSSATNSTQNSIRQLVQAANADQQRVIDQDASVRPGLVELQAQLARLNTPANRAAWQSAGTDPATLAAQIQSDLDQLDHIITTAPVTVAQIKNLGGPAFMAPAAGRLITVTATGAIGIVNPATGNTAVSNAHVSGRVTAVAAAAAGDGIYILTSAPAVWLYKPGTDSLSQVSGGWDQGTAIASYAGNFYELGASGVIKRVPAPGGFSAGQTSLGDSLAGVASAGAMAIDGAIYLGGPQGIFRYEAGALSAKAALPPGFSGISFLSPGSGDYVLAGDTKTGRLAVLASQPTQLALSGVYHVNGLTAASLDTASGKLYAISGSRIVSYTLPK